MSGINKVILIGNLGQDPELKTSDTSDAHCTFSIATSDTWKDKKTGEKKERVEWHRIDAWGRLAEVCGKYLTKGRQVYVEGKLQTKRWEKDGVKHYSTDVLAVNVQFIGGMSAGTQAEQPESDGNDVPF